MYTLDVLAPEAVMQGELEGFRAAPRSPPGLGLAPAIGVLGPALMPGSVDIIPFYPTRPPIG